jgi:hypothetical protein
VLLVPRAAESGLISVRDEITWQMKIITTNVIYNSRITAYFLKSSYIREEDVNN